MSDEKKKDTSPLHPETFFLPPLRMVLAFFDKKARQREKDKEAAGAAEKQEKPTEKDVEKLIEKLSEKEDE
jgi:hypothetical protein